MFAATAIRSTSRVASKAPMSIRAYADKASGSVDKTFNQREQTQENMYVRQQELEQLKALRKKTQQELEAKQKELADIEARHETAQKASEQK
ncbi:ATPase inhibitor, IATP, mitochondria [Phaffia rhodozyma]|uniref:ATPase inhibitor, mitochondrial n=1 Tax=Phaffia rhodozyma TaxID=264483 RepID=A0A0F7SML8_PHARH|nr:ATPase inhibitor, IATP, mitochondria [Phaffia rhodozyma]